MFRQSLRLRSFTAASRAHLSTFVPSASRASRSGLKSALVTAAVGTAGYTFGAFYPPDALTYISPRVAPPPLPADHPDAIALIESLERQLQSLAVLETLRTAPDADQWYETRPYANIPEERRVHHLTTGALRAPGRLAIPALVRAKLDESESVIFIHVGRGLCGHDGIIHGGLLATLLDESLARTAILNLPEKIGVTANLSLNYRAPTRADQFIVIKTKLEDVKGRRAKVTGVIEDLSGNVLVEAHGTFVQPKYANLLNSATVRDALGRPPTAVQSTPA